ncbi:hypothetical protein GDO86_002813 [Hymenochirus boettgeri]|uniref:Beta/gamma crystallin 'Greek key' domain-containing protein n=1 Tax=Hymenochirus boettgeri TaxID=247094 RepID=A0A8T2K2K9_9PIPI|nr:hypothetical protein GDO86_002813 [Hymenochirus boettgeri]
MSIRRRSTSWQEEVAKGFSKFFSRSSQEKEDEGDKVPGGEEQETPSPADTTMSRLFSRTSSQDRKSASDSVEGPQSPSKTSQGAVSPGRNDNSWTDSEAHESQEKSLSLPRLFSRGTSQNVVHSRDPNEEQDKSLTSLSRHLDVTFSFSDSGDESEKTKNKTSNGTFSSHEDKDVRSVQDNNGHLSNLHADQDISTHGGEGDADLYTKAHNQEKQKKEKIREFFEQLFNFSSKSPLSSPKLPPNPEPCVGTTDGQVKMNTDEQININLEEESHELHEPCSITKYIEDSSAYFQTDLETSEAERSVIHQEEEQTPNSLPKQNSGNLEAPAVTYATYRGSKRIRRLLRRRAEIDSPILEKEETTDREPTPTMLENNICNDIPQQLGQSELGRELHGQLGEETTSPQNKNKHHPWNTNDQCSLKDELYQHSTHSEQFQIDEAEDLEIVKLLENGKGDLSVVLRDLQTDEDWNSEIKDDWLQDEAERLGSIMDSQSCFDKSEFLDKKNGHHMTTSPEETTDFNFNMLITDKNSVTETGDKLLNNISPVDGKAVNADIFGEGYSPNSVKSLNTLPCSTADTDEQNGRLFLSTDSVDSGIISQMNTPDDHPINSYSKLDKLAHIDDEQEYNNTVESERSVSKISIKLPTQPENTSEVHSFPELEEISVLTTNDTTRDSNGGILTANISPGLEIVATTEKTFIGHNGENEEISPDPSSKTNSEDVYIAKVSVKSIDVKEVKITPYTFESEVITVSKLPTPTLEPELICLPNSTQMERIERVEKSSTNYLKVDKTTALEPDDERFHLTNEIENILVNNPNVRNLLPELTNKSPDVAIENLKNNNFMAHLRSSNDNFINISSVTGRPENEIDKILSTSVSGLEAKDINLEVIQKESRDPSDIFCDSSLPDNINASYEMNRTSPVIAIGSTSEGKEEPQDALLMQKANGIVCTVINRATVEVTSKKRNESENGTLPLHMNNKYNEDFEISKDALEDQGNSKVSHNQIASVLNEINIDKKNQIKPISELNSVLKDDWLQSNELRPFGNTDNLITPDQTTEKIYIENDDPFVSMANKIVLDVIVSAKENVISNPAEEVIRQNLNTDEKNQTEFPSYVNSTVIDGGKIVNISHQETSSNHHSLSESICSNDESDLNSSINTWDVYSQLGNSDQSQDTSIFPYTDEEEAECAGHNQSNCYESWNNTDLEELPDLVTHSLDTRVTADQTVDFENENGNRAAANIEFYNSDDFPIHKAYIIDIGENDGDPVDNEHYVSDTEDASDQNSFLLVNARRKCFYPLSLSPIYEDDSSSEDILSNSASPKKAKVEDSNNRSILTLLQSVSDRLKQSNTAEEISQEQFLLLDDKIDLFPLAHSQKEISETELAEIQPDGAAVVQQESSQQPIPARTNLFITKTIPEIKSLVSSGRQSILLQRTRPSALLNFRYNTVAKSPTAPADDSSLEQNSDSSILPKTDASASPIQDIAKERDIATSNADITKYEAPDVPTTEETNIATSNVDTPKYEAPDVPTTEETNIAISNVNTPKYEALDVPTTEETDIATSNADTPKYEAPDVPTTEETNIATSNVDTTKYEAPDFPTTEETNITTSNVNTPKYEAPDVPTTEETNIATSNVDTPKYEAPDVPTTEETTLLQVTETKYEAPDVPTTEETNITTSNVDTPKYEAPDVATTPAPKDKPDIFQSPPEPNTANQKLDMELKQQLSPRSLYYDYYHNSQNYGSPHQTKVERSQEDDSSVMNVVDSVTLKENPRPGKVVISDVLDHENKIELNGDVADLTLMVFPNGVNVRVIRGCWILYENPEFEGQAHVLEEGEAEMHSLWGTPDSKSSPNKMTIGSVKRVPKDHIPEVLLSPLFGTVCSPIALRSEVPAIENLTYRIPHSLEVKSGVWLTYNEPQYSGAVNVLEEGYELPDIEEYGIRSLRPLKMGGLKVQMPGDPKIILYEKPYFEGWSREFTEHIYSFKTLLCDSDEQEVGSVRVLGGIWVGYEMEGFKGRQYLLEEGEYTDWLEWGGFTNSLQSMRYLQADFMESAVTLYQSELDVKLDLFNQGISDLEQARFGSVTQSIDVKKGMWVAYQQKHYCGEQYILEKGRYKSCVDWGGNSNTIESIRPVLLEPHGKNEPKHLIKAYSNVNFQGDCLNFTNEVSEFKPFMPSSFRVLRGCWLLCYKGDVSDNLCVLEEGHYPDMAACGCPTALIKFIQPIDYVFAEPSLSLFALDSCEGRELHFEEAVNSVLSRDLHFYTQSVWVKSGMWVAYEDANFLGKQILLEAKKILNWAEYSGWKAIGSLRPLKQPTVYFKIKNQHSNKYLTANEKLSNLRTTFVGVVPRNGQSSQVWYFCRGLVKCKCNDLCLEIIGGKYTPGSKVSLCAEHGKPRQKWRINKNGTITSYTNDDLVLDLKGGNYYDQNHMVVNRFRQSEPTQIWDIEIL